MTIDEFVERLSNTSRLGWKASDAYLSFKRIRREAYGIRDCPISAVTGKPDDLPYALNAGTKLGLSREDAMAIIDAADDIRGHDRGLRSRLLEACGL